MVGRLDGRIVGRMDGRIVGRMVGRMVGRLDRRITVEPTRGIETLEPADLVRAGTSAAAPTPRSSRQARRTVEDGEHLVVKVATSSGRDDLRREAEVLEALRGPCVVSFIALDDGPESTRLTARDTGGPSLSAALAAPSTTTRDRIRLLATACRTVADLHASGWAHGRLCADHVVLTLRGRMRLCSLSGAERIHVDPAKARQDRIALLRMVDDLTASGTRIERWRILDRMTVARLARRTSRLPDDPDPLVLARILDRSAGDQRFRSGWAVPVLRTPGPIRVPSGRSTLIGVAAAGALLVVTAIGTSTLSGTPPAESPAVAAVDGIVTFEGRRYRVGDPGDLVSVGDWDCDGGATAAVVRAGSDTVQVFDEWATATRPATARTIGHVSGARTITSDDERCGALLVTTADGRTIRLRVDRP